MKGAIKLGKTVQIRAAACAHCGTIADAWSGPGAPS